MIKTISNAIKHFKKVCTHKHYVRKNCFKAGLYIQGILHDMSKFSPTEFFESVKYYQGTDSPINACKKVNGYSMAWMHHKGRNKHHYEYWQDNFDQGGHPIQMPYKYALELVCDYLAAGQAYQGKNFTYDSEYSWWLNKKAKPIAMDPVTKRFVENMLYTMKTENSNDCLKPARAKQIYKESICEN